MWQKLPAFIREWPILIVGVLLIVPFLYFLPMKRRHRNPPRVRRR